MMKNLSILPKQTDGSYTNQFGMVCLECLQEYFFRVQSKCASICPKSFLTFYQFPRYHIFDLWVQKHLPNIRCFDSCLIDWFKRTHWLRDLHNIHIQISGDIIYVTQIFQFLDPPPSLCPPSYALKIAIYCHFCNTLPFWVTSFIETQTPLS